MGLDMHLRGRASLWTTYDNPTIDMTFEGFTVDSVIIELGYWRKHADLHGYIVREFADGVDECQEIELDVDKLRQLIAVCGKQHKKPLTEEPTTGFFFGGSYRADLATKSEEDSIATYKQELKTQAMQDVKQLTKALQWLLLGELANDKRKQQVSRHVFYRASW